MDACGTPYADPAIPQQFPFSFGFLSYLTPLVSSRLDSYRKKALYSCGMAFNTPPMLSPIHNSKP